MKLNELKFFKLDYSKTINFFINQIDFNNCLSKLIISNVNFDNGEFFTILKKPYDAKSLYNFDYGIFPSPKNHKYKSGYVPKTTIKNEIMSILYNYLSLNSQNIMLVDCAAASPTDKYLPQVEELKIIGEEVYFFLTNTSPYDMVKEAIYDSSRIWHLLGILSKSKTFDFEIICKNIECIFTTAYDGEGYILWLNDSDEFITKLQKQIETKSK